MAADKDGGGVVEMKKETNVTPQQLDLICTRCPLEFCQQESLWCIYRFLTNPNKAQIEAAGWGKAVKLTPRRAPISRSARSKYFHDYYLLNREKKLAASKARYHAKRGLATTTSE